MPVRLHTRPTVYEINTAVWLERLGRAGGVPLSLDAVPTSAWDALAALPVDAVWLMGVWTRSPAGRAIATANPDVMAGIRDALPDAQDSDIIGSPYCVREYVVDERFGGPPGLAAARRQLAARGLSLILDYVPNHVAPDHPWLVTHPECFLHASEEELSANPEAFLRTAAGIVANGRDPYFAPWPDVVQLNAFAPALRDHAARTLADIAGQCDGVRCDMAMLMTNDVFTRTWGARAGAVPDQEYWPQVIAAAREAHPDFRFIAEAYWDMEWTLQQQGFDFCYDKRLYDRLVHGDAQSVRSHLSADPAYQERLLRFIENHDEPRAAATFGATAARAAAVAMSTLQGARMYHDGQFDGHRIHIPVFLGRGPDEPPDADLEEFYGRLLGAIDASGIHDGDWALCSCSGWPDNASWRQLVAWCWSGAAGRHLVVVNLADSPAQARVHLPWGDDLAGRTWRLSDALSDAVYVREGDELAADGLYVAMEPWSSYLLTLSG